MRLTKAFLAAAIVLAGVGTLAAQMPPPPPGGPFYIATQKRLPDMPMQMGMTMGMGMGVETKAVVLAGPSPFMMLLKSANLTQAQQAQLRQVMQAQGAKNAAVMQQIRDVEEQISSRLLSPEPLKASDIAPLAQKAAQLKQQVDQSMIDTSLAIRNILTVEQLKHLAKVRQQLESLRAQIESLMGPGPDMMYMQGPPPPGAPPPPPHP